jgi:CHRD domain-containing protein
MNVSRLLILTTMISLALITATAVTNMPAPSYAQTQFSAVLTGAGVFPPVQTNATGKAMLNLVGGGQVMKYNISGTNVDHVSNVVITHSTGGRYTDLVTLRSGVQEGLSGKAKTASLVGNFTAADITGGGNLAGFKKDMPSLVKDILSGNVYVKVDTVKFPLGAVAGKLKSGT